MPLVSDDKILEAMEGVQEGKGIKITERVPYTDEPEIREYKTKDYREASTKIKAIQSDMVASEITDIELFD